MMNPNMCKRMARTSRALCGVVCALMIPYQGKGVLLASDLPQPLLVPQQYPTIQAAIDAAQAGDVIQVAPGVYRENVAVTGKDLVLRCVDPNDPNVTAATVIEGNGTDRVVSLQDCSQRCILAGLTIRGGGTGLWCSGGQPAIQGCQIVENSGPGLELLGGAAPAVEHSLIAANGGLGVKMPQASGRTGVGGAPVIVNCTIVQNAAGGIYGGAPVVRNSILYFNGTGPNAFQIGPQRPRVTYSCVQGGFSGEGNANVDPLFARLGRWTEPNDANYPTRTWLAGDYHLQSRAGRWDAGAAAWVTDERTSPCINAANPADPVGLEPAPNGRRADLGAYGGTLQASKTLVEPGQLCYELEFSTYIGGQSYDDGFFQSIGPDGSIYMTGNTNSPDFPITVGAYDPTLNPGWTAGTTDLFVTKMAPDGRSLVYSTFIGGSDYDGHDYWNAVDDSGRVYIAGQTSSRDFPLTQNAFDKTYNGGDVDVVVCVLDPAGTRLEYSTLLGGNKADNPAGIQVDAAGNIYVYGFTDSTDFPCTRGAYDTTPDGTQTAFLAKLNPSAGRLEYSTLLPGKGGMDSKFLVDEQGNAFICTSQVTSGLATTPGALFRTFQGGENDVYIAKLNATGTDLIFATYLGGSSREEVGAVVLDENGSLVVVGLTQSPDFPTTDGSNEQVKAGMSCLFIAVLDPTGSRLLSSSVLHELQGGIFDAAMDPAGKLLAVTTYTSSTNLPTTAYALDAIYNGGDSDIYLAVYDYETLKRRYATYIGGSLGDYAFSVDFDRPGDLRLSGNTFSTDFPLRNAWQSLYKGGYKDGIVLKLRRVSLDEDGTLPPSGG